MQLVDAIGRIFKSDPIVPGFSRPATFRHEKGLRDKIDRLETVFESESTDESNKNPAAVTGALNYRQSTLVPAVDILVQETLYSNGEPLEFFALEHLFELVKMSLKASHPVEPVNPAVVKLRLQDSVKIPAFSGLTLKVIVPDVTNSLLSFGDS